MIISSKLFHLQLNGKRLIQRLFSKFGALFIRLLDVMRYFPKRFVRLLEHIVNGCKTHLIGDKLVPVLSFRFLRRTIYWWVEFSLLLLDCLGVSELYEGLFSLLKFNTRPLHNWEKQLARQLFGDHLNYDRIRVDEFAFIGPKQGAFCYVSFNIINSWGPISNSIFLHELTHVWQYQKLGIVYIPRALFAQASMEGYDYGGLESLQEAKSRGDGLLSFNLEQQADIVADYYRIKTGYRPNWGNGTISDLPLYEYFIADLRQ